jgi:hypothetical protein
MEFDALPLGNRNIRFGQWWQYLKQSRNSALYRVKCHGNKLFGTCRHARCFFLFCALHSHLLNRLVSACEQIVNIS